MLMQIASAMTCRGRKALRERSSWRWQPGRCAPNPVFTLLAAQASGASAPAPLRHEPSGDACMVRAAALRPWPTSPGLLPWPGPPLTSWHRIVPARPATPARATLRPGADIGRRRRPFAPDGSPAGVERSCTRPFAQCGLANGTHATPLRASRRFSLPCRRLASESGALGPPPDRIRRPYHRRRGRHAEITCVRAQHHHLCA
jgi:hypothetical protein